MSLIPTQTFYRNGVFAPIQGTASPPVGSTNYPIGNRVFTPMFVAPPPEIPRRRTLVVTIRM